MKPEIKHVLYASDLPTAWRPASAYGDDDYLVQRLEATTEMPIRDLMALFLWDNDLGMRFERVGTGAVLEFLYLGEDRVEITVGVKRECVESASDDEPEGV